MRVYGKTFYLMIGLHNKLILKQPCKTGLSEDDWAISTHYDANKNKDFDLLATLSHSFKKN